MLCYVMLCYIMLHYVILYYIILYYIILYYIIILYISTCMLRGTQWRSWLRHYATSWKVVGSIPNSVTGSFY